MTNPDAPLNARPDRLSFSIQGVKPNIQVSAEDERTASGGTRVLTIPYPNDLLLSLEDEETFATEAQLLLAVKLYELDRISTGMAARLASMSRVAFIFALNRFGLSPNWSER